jgi:hypothetical protein
MLDPESVEKSRIRIRNNGQVYCHFSICLAMNMATTAAEDFNTELKTLREPLVITGTFFQELCFISSSEMNEKNVLINE